MTTATMNKRSPSPPVRRRIEEIKLKNPIDQVARALGVKLEGSGSLLMGVCPLHKDSDPSFAVYAREQRFHCYGCEERGDALDLVGKMKNWGLRQTMDWLDSAKIVSEESKTAAQTRARFSKRARIIRQSTEREREAIEAYVSLASRALLESRSAKSARAYLKSRGVTRAAAVSLQLGFGVPGAYETLAAQGFHSRELSGAGLFKWSDGAVSQRFENMITVPNMATDNKGKPFPSYVVGRAVDPNALPRFQSLPGRKPLLGFADWSKSAASSVLGGWAILTEGVFDWVTLRSWGLPCIATLGADGMASKVPRIAKRVSKVFVAMDDDPKGRAAAGAVKEMLGDRAALVKLPSGASDVGELATVDRGASLFRAAIHEAAKTAGWDALLTTPRRTASAGALAAAG